MLLDEAAQIKAFQSGGVEACEQHIVDYQDIKGSLLIGPDQVFLFPFVLSDGGENGSGFQHATALQFFVQGNSLLRAGTDHHAADRQMASCCFFGEDAETKEVFLDVLCQCGDIFRGSGDFLGLQAAFLYLLLQGGEDGVQFQPVFRAYAFP